MAEHMALILPAKQAPMVLKSVPTYKPGPGEVLIKVEAAALAPIDWAISVLGVLVEKYPIILGEEVAGTVADIGEGVTRFKKGDRVYEAFPAGSRSLMTDDVVSYILQDL